MHRFRTALLACLLAATLLLGACTPINAFVEGFQEGLAEGSGGSTSGSAEKLQKDTVYHNDLFGLTLTLPKGWWLQYAKEKNLSTSAGVSIKEADMTRSSDDEDYFTYDLVQISNERNDSNVHHAMADISIYHDTDDMTAQQLAQYWASSFDGEDDDGFVYTHLDTSEVTTAGVAMDRVMFLVETPNGDHYEEHMYFYRLTDVDYLMCIVNFWPNDKRSTEDAENILDDVLSIHSVNSTT